jgi:hypothetical protein
VIAMIPLSDWLPLLLVGSTFTFFGVAKSYGLARGVEGGCDKSFGEKLCGACPDWKSPVVRIGFPLFFLVIGLAELAQLAWLVYSATRHR